ncbi:hypothetical protein BDL97_17G107200 [Sphagnum fallax]|nr:hypothetical protein BDL97_17G107200 [Sphagnum fallax]
MELNVVDTPGHADFGGEGQLVVDAGEGPLAQTKFVVVKALKLGLRPILLLNKVDQPSEGPPLLKLVFFVGSQRCSEVETLVFDLFANLGASDEQLEFPALYASAKEGWVSQGYTKCTEGEERTVAPLMDAIVEHVGDLHAPFRMLVSMMEHDLYLGWILTGRIASGVVMTTLTLLWLFGFVLVDCTGAGDIVSVAGLSQPSIGHTVSAAELVQGRGELQLEGFELSVSPPAVMYNEENGKKLEPIEEVIIEVNDDHAGLIIEALSHRHAAFLEMGPCPEAVGCTRLSFTCPSSSVVLQGLLGYQSVFSTDTHGTGFMHRAFLTYGKYWGPLGNVRKVITAHTLMGLQACGILFVEPGMETYDGMLIGEHSHETDLEVNPVHSKELNEIRTAGKEENVCLTPPRMVSVNKSHDVLPKIVLSNINVRS